mgnify:FL=1
MYNYPCCICAKSPVVFAIWRIAFRGLSICKKHILVIDDEMVVTQVLAQLLIRCPYKVTIALNGQQDIELFRADPADLVIVDA